MSSIDARSVVLVAHPSTPNDAVRKLGVELRAEAPDILVFRYSLDAEMARVRIPPTSTRHSSPGPSSPGPSAHELWKHTCFEAFIAPGDAPGYHEFNFSPSLAWAIYRFEGYRDGMSPAEISEVPQLSVCRADDLLELRAAVTLRHLPPLHEAHRWRIALAAVVEDEEGRLSYWGLRHPPCKPDFHHPNGFVLEIARS